MIIERSDQFSIDLSTILKYIAIDNIHRARKFKNSLKNSIGDIPNMPYKHRKSIYFDDENIRDYIFMGYCIPYLIQMENNRIVLLGVIKWRQF